MLPLAERLVSHASHETVERRAVGHSLQPERLTQGGVLGKSHLGPTEGLVLEAHQAEIAINYGCMKVCLE